MELKYLSFLWYFPLMHSIVLPAWMILLYDILVYILTVGLTTLTKYHFSSCKLQQCEAEIRNTPSSHITTVLLVIQNSSPIDHTIIKTTNIISELKLELFALLVITLPFHLLFLLRHLLRNHVRKVFLRSRYTSTTPWAGVIPPPQFLLRYPL